MPHPLDQRISENYQSVLTRVAEAAHRSGRKAGAVTLVGVTKYVEADLIQVLVEAGCRDLGESRPQQLWAKAEQLDADVRWHLIGHLQRNKVGRTLPLVALIHSVDSQRLMQAIHAAAAASTVQVLLEVNVSGDPAKHGFAPDELAAALEAAANYPQLRVCGLMAMAAMSGGPERARRDFAALRQLRDATRDNCPENVELNELSMGMSGDFEQAIMEGATMVRVGSALYEGCSV